MEQFLVELVVVVLAGLIRVLVLRLLLPALPTATG